MEPDVERLASDSGELVDVAGIPSPGGRFRAIELGFAAGTLRLGCDDDTDEIIARVVEPHGGDLSVAVEPLVDLIGLTVESAWELRNHRGYTDAFQLRLVDGRGRDETRQFEVAASVIDVRRVDG